jgi:hypothetical protein
MPIRPTLLVEIQNALGPNVTPNLTATSSVSDIFEAYIFGLILEAARTEQATVTFQNVLYQTPAVFVFRTSPGYIFSNNQPYTHAVIQFPGKPTLEAHIGIRVSGRSTVLHECDVAVLLQTEAETCRRNLVNPRSSKLVIAVECKFYSTSIPLSMARGFVGLQVDLSARDCYFVINTNSVSAEKLLSKLDKIWGTSIIPSSPVSVTRLRNLFQTSFVKFKAMN